MSMSSVEWSNEVYVSEDLFIYLLMLWGINHFRITSSIFSLVTSTSCIADVSISFVVYQLRFYLSTSYTDMISKIQQFWLKCHPPAPHRILWNKIFLKDGTALIGPQQPTSNAKVRLHVIPKLMSYKDPLFE